MAKKKEEEKDQVKIRILPFKGIGGVGNAGDTALMDLKEAEQYERDGYVEIITDEEPLVVHSSATSQDDEQGVSSEDKAVEDHVIMKPENKRD